MDLIVQIQQRGTGGNALPPEIRAAMHAMLRQRVHVRAGGHIELLDSGLVHIAEPCGDGRTVPPCHTEELGDGEESLWFAVSGTSGTGAVAPGGANTYPPYAWSFNSPPPGFPNPNNPSPYGHANVTRHWSAGTTPVWYFNLPDAANPSLPPGSPPATTSSLCSLLLREVEGTVLGATTSLAGYTYGEALWDVAITFAKYSSWQAYPDLPNSVTWLGNTTPGPLPYPFNVPPEATPLLVPSLTPPFYYPSASCVPPNPIPTWSAPPMGVFWSNMTTQFGGYTYHAAYPMPTTLTDTLIYITAPAGPGTGITSPAPTGDGINEVAWCAPNASVFIGLTSMVMDPVSGRIEECDVLYNVNVMRSSLSATQVSISNIMVFLQPIALSVYPGRSVTNRQSASFITTVPHEIGHFMGLDHTNIHPGGHGALQATDWTPVPLPGADASYFQYNRKWLDYPAMVGSITRLWDGTNAYSMNTSTAPLHPDEEAGIVRIYPYDLPSPANVGTRNNIINARARFEGRVLEDDLMTLPIEYAPFRNVFVLPVPNGGVVQYPTNATISGTHRREPSSVVGLRDAGANAPGTADYVLQNVDPTGGVAGAIGTDNMLAVEPMAALGISIGTGLGWTPAEWWYDLKLNSQLRNGPVPPSNRHIAIGSSKPHSTSLGSLYTYAGSVITTNVDLLAMTPVPGTNGNVMVDWASRPAVRMTPRGRSSGVITVTVTSDYPSALPTAVWVVNGVIKPAGPPATQVPAPGPGAVGPFTTTWTIAESALGIVYANTVTPMRVQFRVQEVAPGTPGGPPASIITVAGVNECVY